MGNMPATLQLMSETITTAQTASTKTVVVGLARAKSLSIQFNFTYGSAGTSVKAWVQTSFDAGVTWVDIANYAGTNVSEPKLYNLTSSTPVTTIYLATDGTLADNTSKDGLIGNQLRVKFTSTGTYATNTTFSVFVNARQ